MSRRCKPLGIEWPILSLRRVSGRCGRVLIMPGRASPSQLVFLEQCYPPTFPWEKPINGKTVYTEEKEKGKEWKGGKKRRKKDGRKERTTKKMERQRKNKSERKTERKKEVKKVLQATITTETVTWIGFANTAWDYQKGRGVRYFETNDLTWIFRRSAFNYGEWICVSKIVKFQAGYKPADNGRVKKMYFRAAEWNGNTVTEIVTCRRVVLSHQQAH